MLWYFHRGETAAMSTPDTGDDEESAQEGHALLEAVDIRMLPMPKVHPINNISGRGTVKPLPRQKRPTANSGAVKTRHTVGFSGAEHQHKKGICAATRGVLPHIKGRTQENSSVLGRVLMMKQAPQRSTTEVVSGQNRNVGIPWSSQINNIRFSKIEEMDADLTGEMRELASMSAARQQKGPARDMMTVQRAPSSVNLMEQSGLAGKQPTGTAKSPSGAASPSGAEAKGALEALKQDVGVLRGYLQLLDQYSLHHFIIYKAKTVDNTPEFDSFHRLYATRWGSIMSAITSLETMLKKHNVPVAVVDGPRLAQLAVLEVLQTDQLLSCIANFDQIQPLLLLQNSSVDRKHKKRARAAIKIQAIVRGFITRRRFTELRVVEKAATVVQSAFRVFFAVRRMQRAIRRKRAGVSQRSLWVMDALRKSWKSIVAGAEHVIVHLPSLSLEEHLRLGMPNFVQRQNLQLARAYDGISTRHATVIYVAPYHLPEEVMDYIRKLYDRLGIGSRRLHVLVPENGDCFPAHFSLASLVLYSPRCLQRIRSIVKGRPAYIVPAAPGWQDRKLADVLGLPLLAPDPTVAQEYATRSGCKRMFVQANVNIPVGAHDIYDEEALVLALTKLIAANLLVDRWFIKLDVDYDNLSCAYFDVQLLECVVALRKEKTKLEDVNGQNPDVWQHQDVQLLARTKIIKDLKTTLQKKVVLCCPDLFLDWDAFLAYLKRYGCVIEAEPKNIRGYPSVSLLIDPLGNVSVEATYDLVIENRTYSRLASFYPCDSVPHKALQGASLSVGRQLYEHKVVGHVTVNFIVFMDQGRKQLRMWALEVVIGLSPYGSCHKLFNLFKHGRLRPDVKDTDGVSTDTSASPADHYGLLEFVPHPSFSGVATAAFFRACRMEGISYNLDSHRGIVLQLLDSLSGGGVGVMGLAQSTLEALAHLINAMNFLKRHLGAQSLAMTVEGREFLRTLHVLVAHRQRIERGNNAADDRNGKNVHKAPP